MITHSNGLKLLEFGRYVFSACDQISFMANFLNSMSSELGFFYLSNFTAIWRSRLSRGHNEY